MFVGGFRRTNVVMLIVSNIYLVGIDTDVYIFLKINLIPTSLLENYKV